MTRAGSTATAVTA